jgi:hypothetical protein
MAFDDYNKRQMGRGGTQGGTRTGRLATAAGNKKSR